MAPMEEKKEEKKEPFQVFKEKFESMHDKLEKDFEYRRTVDSGSLENLDRFAVNLKAFELKLGDEALPHSAKIKLKRLKEKFKPMIFMIESGVHASLKDLNKMMEETLEEISGKE